MNRTRWLLIASFCVAFAAAPLAQADLYGFHRITANSPTNVASQFLVDISDSGSGLVKFRFLNSAEVASSICDVYFDADSLLSSIDSLSGSAGVSFSALASPPSLPGGSGADPDFQTTLGLSADSDPPVLANGVNASNEYLDVVAAVESDVTFSDVLAGLGSGSLRIGIHVQGIDGGTSDSFVSDPAPYVPPDPVPAPGALLLGVFGLGIVSRLGRSVGWL